MLLSRCVDGHVGDGCKKCMRMVDASLQVEAARAAKLLGSLAMSFENITDYDGVLVQGKLAQEGEATSSASPCAIRDAGSSAVSADTSA